jgi:hypothetical protein
LKPSITNKTPPGCACIRPPLRSAARFNSTLAKQTPINQAHLSVLDDDDNACAMSCIMMMIIDDSKSGGDDDDGGFWWWVLADH